MLKKEVFNSLKKYIVYFYVYAFFGWIIDVSICLVSDGVVENRGFLYETICPMYGFAALALIMLSKVFKGKGNLIKRVFLATIWCTVLEYLTALILEMFFGLKWWDYSKEPYNLQGRICLVASIFWGVLATVFMEYIHPLIEKVTVKISSKIPIKIRNITILTILTGTEIDLVLSIIKYLK